MKIAIDYRLAANSNRGMARYCREITKELFSLDTENEYYLIVNKIPVDMQLPVNFSFIKICISNFIFAEQISVPHIAKKYHCSVLWCPYNTFPVFLSKKIQLFVTIHDLIFMNKPNKKETLYKRIGRLYRKIIVKKYSNRIDGYFTVSKFSNMEIQKILHLNCFLGLTVNCLSKNFVELARQYATMEKKNYFFTVSGDSPSKNLLFLIDIFNNFLPNEKLYIAGLSCNSPLRKYQTDKIIFLPENISDKALIEKYSSCKAFLFPSLQEGFGIPIIEAFCCHAKVISSNKTCLPEIIGERGLLFSPTDSKNFLQCIDNVDTYPFSYDVNEYISWKKPAQIVLNSILTT